MTGFGVQGSGCGLTGKGQPAPLDPAAPRRGSALLLSLVIAGVLTLLATAFIITAQVERQAAVNVLRGAQAEAACRAGLAAAIYRVELTAGLYAADAGHLPAWHSYFFDAAGPDLCPDSWVSHYDASIVDGGMTAREFDLIPGDSFRHQKGFRARYYAAVADLDGKLHCNPRFINSLLQDTAPDHQTQDMLDMLGLASTQARDALLNDAAANWSLGQLRVKLIAGGVPKAEYELNEAERFFTVYPRALNLTKADMGRPAVNVNTARKEVLRAIVRNVPGFDGALAGTVADKLAARRPFGNRRDMEKALVELGPAAWEDLPAGCVGVDGVLNEKQMNDLLNSLAGTNAADESEFDRVSTPGLYTYDFDDKASANRQDNGDHATAASDPPATETAADCWGTEAKFTSRFFHIYTLGRTLSYVESPPRVTAERRLHAVYDAEAHKVLWLRWNFGAKANMAD